MQNQVPNKKTVNFKGKICKQCKLLGVGEIKGQMLVMKNIERPKGLSKTFSVGGAWAPAVRPEVEDGIGK